MSTTHPYEIVYVPVRITYEPCDMNPDHVTVTDRDTGNVVVDSDAHDASARLLHIYRTLVSRTVFEGVDFDYVDLDATGAPTKVTDIIGACREIASHSYGLTLNEERTIEMPDLRHVCHRREDAERALAGHDGYVRAVDVV